MSAAVPRPAATRRQPGTTWLLAHPQDIHCVFYHMACLAGYGTAFYYYLHPQEVGLTTTASKVAFVFGAALMLGWASGVDVGVNFHNHAHVPIFRSRVLSRWFGRLWTISGGWPAFFWHHSHVTVHHLHLLDPAIDWTLPKRKADGTLEGYVRYSLLHWPWRYGVHLWRDFRARPELGRKALLEFAIFLPLWSIPFWIDPVMALCLWVFPQWIGNVSFMAAGMYVQHVACVPKTPAQPLEHSNIFTQRAFNLFMFNIGYHLEHHDHPSVHWSDLPALHERLKPELISNGARVHNDHGYFRNAARFGFDFRGDAVEKFSRHPHAYQENATAAGPR